MKIIRQNLIIILLLIFNIAIIVSWFFVYNQIQYLVGDIKEISLKRQELTLHRRQNLLLDNELEKNKDKIEKLKSYFITEDDLIYLVEEFENLARQADIYFEITNLETKDDLKFNFRATGRLEDLEKLFVNINKAPYFSAMRNFVLKKVGDDDWLALVELNILSFR